MGSTESMRFRVSPITMTNPIALQLVPLPRSPNVTTILFDFVRETGAADDSSSVPGGYVYVAHLRLRAESIRGANACI